MTDILRELGNQVPEGEKLARKYIVASKLWERAANGDDAILVKYVFDRLDGTPRQSIDINDGAPLEIIIKHDTEGI